MICDNCDSEFNSLKFLRNFGNNTKIKICDKCLLEILDGRKRMLQEEIDLINKEITRIVHDE